MSNAKNRLKLAFKSSQLLARTTQAAPTLGETQSNETRSASIDCQQICLIYKVVEVLLLWVTFHSYFIPSRTDFVAGSPNREDLSLLTASKQHHIRSIGITGFNCRPHFRHFVTLARCSVLAIQVKCNYDRRYSLLVSRYYITQLREQSGKSG